MTDSAPRGSRVSNQRLPSPKKLSAWKRWVSLLGYGLFTSILFRARTPPQTLRARFERFGGVSRNAILRKYPKVIFEDHRSGSLWIESVCAVDQPSCIIVHLHGGAFVFGSPASYRNRAMRLSYRFKAKVFIPDYRLAPEHPFPAALEDALATFQHVRALHPSSNLFVTGDSAGGGLALSVLVRLRELGRATPNGAILLSPWTDLSISGPSVDGNHGKDRWFTRAHLMRWARYYAGATDPRNPLMSPLFADLSKLPPLLVLVGEDELLLDDAIRVRDAAVHAGTDARLLVGKRMQHDWPLTLPWLDESKDAWRVMSSFVEEQCSARVLNA